MLVGMVEHGPDIKFQLRFGAPNTDLAMAQLLQYNYMLCQTQRRCPYPQTSKGPRDTIPHLHWLVSVCNHQKEETCRHASCKWTQHILSLHIYILYLIECWGFLLRWEVLLWPSTLDMKCLPSEAVQRTVHYFRHGQHRPQSVFFNINNIFPWYKHIDLPAPDSWEWKRKAWGTASKRYQGRDSSRTY